MSERDYLTPILARKREEIARRRRHRLPTAQAQQLPLERAELALASLRRGSGQALRVIAEIKRRSPSAGELRPRKQDDIAWLCREFGAGGAGAISVLCDAPGFAGSPLDVRRAVRETALPVLFKEFVLDELQISLARELGAHMVLLIVRALAPERLHALVAAVQRAGMAPVVEAASAREVEIALTTEAAIIGVNARDLKTFRVDPAAAQAILSLIPRERVAVHMSGVHTRADFELVERGRADAALIGESLMRADSPRRKLVELRGQA